MGDWFFDILLVIVICYGGYYLAPHLPKSIVNLYCRRNEKPLIKYNDSTYKFAAFVDIELISVFYILSPPIRKDLIVLALLITMSVAFVPVIIIYGITKKDEIFDKVSLAYYIISAALLVPFFAIFYW